MQESITRKTRTSSLMPGSLIGSMNDVEQLLYKSIGENNHANLSRFLDQRKAEVDVLRILESRSYSLLAFCCFKNHTHCFRIVYEHGTKYCIEPKLPPQEKMRKLTQWANMPTDEGFTALQFASYHGNLELIKILVE